MDLVQRPGLTENQFLIVESFSSTVVNLKRDIVYDLSELTEEIRITVRRSSPSTDVHAIEYKNDLKKFKLNWLLKDDFSIAFVQDVFYFRSLTIRKQIYETNNLIDIR